MDEMDMLKDALATPGPSSDTVRKRRGELEQLIRHQSRARTRRRGWRMAGIGLAAAAVAVAVTAAVMFTSGPPRTRPGAAVRSTATGHRPATAKQSVQQMLLTAAASAQRAPAGSGTYWYVRVRAATGNGNKLYLAESWTKRDGQTWIRDQKGGTPIELPRSPAVLGPFFLGGRELTFHQLQHLPADPAALTRWIVTNAARHGGKSGGPVPGKAQEREDIFDSLDLAAVRTASHAAGPRRRLPRPGRAPGSYQPGPGRRRAGRAVHPAGRSAGHPCHRPGERADSRDELLRRQPGRRVLAEDSQRDDHRPVDRHAPIGIPGKRGRSSVRNTTGWPRPGAGKPSQDSRRKTLGHART